MEHDLFGKPASTFPDHVLTIGTSRLSIGWVEQLEARPAFELAMGVFLGLRIDGALARLAQKMRLDSHGTLRYHFLTAPFNGHGANRRLALGRRNVGTLPTFRPVMVDDFDAKQMRHAALDRSSTRIADSAAR